MLSWLAWLAWYSRRMQSSCSLEQNRAREECHHSQIRLPSRRSPSLSIRRPSRSPPSFSITCITSSSAPQTRRGTGRSYVLRTTDYVVPRSIQFCWCRRPTVVRDQGKPSPRGKLTRNAKYSGAWPVDVASSEACIRIPYNLLTNYNTYVRGIPMRGAAAGDDAFRSRTGQA